MGRNKILVVDDEMQNVMVLKGLLSQMGHEVIGAENAIVGMTKLDRTIDLVLSDVMMPEMDGFEFVEAIRANPEFQDIPIIMVTTLSEKEDRLRAVEAGANDFITKPVDTLELRVRTESMLKQKAQHDELLAFQADLHEMVEARTKDLRHTLLELDRAYVEAIHHLSAAAEFKDEDTANHLMRMALYSALIAEKMALDKGQVDVLKVSAPMHDVGKIGIPDHILLKPGSLSDEEWETMKTHSNIGASILGAGNSDYMNVATLIALTHHERWDGSGYPAGLSGEDIPLEGRICAVADVFDALTSKRPYKDAFSVEKAIEIMEQGRGSHFDPEILDVFFACMDEVLEIKEQYSD